MTLRITPYQQEILDLVRAGDPDGTPDGIDLDQILDRASWTPSKQSLQFVIRALIRKGLVCKNGTFGRRGRQRVCFALASAGKFAYDPREPAAPAEAEVDVPEVYLED